jgi:hypothetical protein
MFVSNTGKNLSVLICTDYTFIYNWMSFAAWYSVSKNLPDAKIAVVSSRNNMNLQLYKWANKVDVKFFLHKNVGLPNNIPYLNKIYGTYVAVKESLVDQPLLVLDSDMMCLRNLSNDNLEKLNSSSFATNHDGSMWYFNNHYLEKFSDAIHKVKELNGKSLCNDHLDFDALKEVFGEPLVVDDLCNEVYEPNVTSFTHYRQKCGNFFRKEYEKGLAYPPFVDQQALRTIDMTANERKVFSLWSQMHMSFEALSK